MNNPKATFRIYPTPSTLLTAHREGFSVYLRLREGDTSAESPITPDDARLFAYWLLGFADVIDREALRWVEIRGA